MGNQMYPFCDITFFLRGSHVPLTGLCYSRGFIERLIFLPLSPKCWDYMCALPASTSFLKDRL